MDDYGRGSKYPWAWGICQQVYPENVPTGIRVYENVISGQLYAIVDNEDADLGILKTLGVESWTF